MSVMTIHLKEEDCLTDEEADALRGAKLDDKSYRLLVKNDADVYKPDGSLLLRFRKNVIPYNIAAEAYPVLRKAATLTNNRGTAAGFLKQNQDDVPEDVKVQTGPTHYRRVRQDGTLSNTEAAVNVNSGIIGYFDRYPRIPYCRQTAFNIQRYTEFRDILYPLIKSIDRLYSELVPDAYAKQRKLADETSQDFVIRGTSFTTVTVNKNWQTAVHKDAGDYPEGFGNLAVVEAGRYDGCYTCFPKYRVAADVRTCDFLAMDVHEWHGNTPIVPVSKRYERVAIVCYYRENMWKCGTAQQELERAKEFGPKNISSPVQGASNANDL